MMLQSGDHIVAGESSSRHQAIRQDPQNFGLVAPYVTPRPQRSRMRARRTPSEHDGNADNPMMPITTVAYEEREAEKASSSWTTLCSPYPRPFDTAPTVTLGTKYLTGTSTWSAESRRPDYALAERMQFSEPRPVRPRSLRCARAARTKRFHSACRAHQNGRKIAAWLARRSSRE